MVYVCMMSAKKLLHQLKSQVSHCQHLATHRTGSDVLRGAAKQGHSSADTRHSCPGPLHQCVLSVLTPPANSHSLANNDKTSHIKMSLGPIFLAPDYPSLHNGWPPIMSTSVAEDEGSTYAVGDAVHPDILRRV